MSLKVSGRDQSAGRPRSGRLKKVTASVTLANDENRVLAIIPLTGTVTITLPPVADAADINFTVFAKRAEGVYVDGVVKLQDQDDNGLANYASNDLTATGDYIHIANCGGFFWKEIFEVST